ncbi:MAG: patatin-like phospholipase family protein [Myxococcota bacterium]|nr:patatin-like phospholipase family protein [Myxococcota bacterium]
MGITLVQKSDLSKPRPKARRALVLAGGAISGGAFKVGGLLALNRFFRNFRVTDFDIYMGVSAGAFLAAPLSSGVEPHELVAALRGSEGRVTKFSYLDFYLPNWREMLGGPARFTMDMATASPLVPLTLLRMLPQRRKDLMERASAFLKRPGLDTAETLFEPILDDLARGPFKGKGGYMPSGVFDNRGIEAYLRKNLERMDLPNDFRQLKLSTGKSLYITATNLNTAQGTIFGHDEDHSVTVSQAVQASTAIPGFFRPARIGPPGAEQDYLDACVRKTANISNAVRKGAELIICYNPFRPFVNYRHRPGSSGRRSVADMGIGAVLNQAFRTMLHSRLRLGMEKLKMDPNFHGDCILIEPAETDARFFDINPLAFWRRAEAAAHGYQSVKSSIERHYEPLKQILNAYDIDVDLKGMEGEFEAIRDARTPGEKLDVMEKSRPEANELRLVVGGR